MKAADALCVHADEDGRLVWVDGKLVAVLVKLSDIYEEPELRGRWFVEAGFGPCSSGHHMVFADLEEAEAWVAQRLAARTAARGVQHVR